MEQLSIKFEYTDEFFTDVKSFEGLYKVSNYGRVWSCKSQKFLRPDTDRDGYKIVSLYKNKKYKKIKLHRLVFYTFNPKADASLQINHIDNVPHNNHIRNLETVNHWENNTHKFNNKKTSSKYRGVTKCMNGGAWRAQIQVNKKKKHIGQFNCETAAYIAYIKEMKFQQVTNKYV